MHVYFEIIMFDKGGTKKNYGVALPTPIFFILFK